MNSRPNLRVRISADLADIRQGLGMLRGELAKVQQGAARVRPPDTSGWSKGLAAVRSQLLGIVSLYGAMRVGGAYIRLADEAASLSGRLRLATKSQQEFTRAQQQTFEIAQQTSAEWGSIVGLYAQLSQTTGMAQERILGLTKTISQAFTVSGASAQETSNGLRQLQQAMAGGVLRAEEFNTIIETSPRIVQALADHFGISFGQVRKYVNDGKVTSEEFAKALEAAAESVQRDFDTMPLTVAKATQQVRNALLKLVGDTDAAGGASKELAEAIADMARVLESDDTKRGFGEIVNALSAIVEFSTKAAAMVGKLNREVKDLSGVSLPKWAQASLMALSGNIPGAVNAYASGRNPPPDFSNVVTGAAGGGAGGRPAGGGGGGGDPAKAIAASNALLRDSVQRALAELDQLYKGHEIGMREYFASRQQLQEQAIDLQIEQARNELAVTKDLGKRRDLEEQIQILLRDRADVAAQAAREERAAGDELIDKLAELKATIAELDGDHVRAARIRIETEFLDLFKRLRAESDSAGETMARNLVDRLVRKAQTDAIANAASGITGRLSSEETSVSAQVDGGMLGFVEGEERLRVARLAAMEQLAEQIRLQREVMAMMEPGSPEHSAALQGLHDLEAGYANVAGSVDVFRNQVKDVATDALTGLFMDLVEGTKSAGEALRDFVRNFALGMAQIAARALATFLVLQMLDAIYPGLGKTTAAMMGAGQNHGGGKAGQVGGVRRWIPEAMLGVAPRYHNGGIAGAPPLKHNEVVSVLERGETIRTQQQERALQAQLDAGSGRMVVKTPVVAIGDRAVANALAGADGEDVILTHVRNNWDALVNGAR